jgi:hypothetical protein
VTLIILRAQRYAGDTADELVIERLQRAFWIVVGIALGVASIAVYIFWKRDWF